MSAIQKYSGFSSEDLDESKKATEGGGGKFLKLKSGKNQLRFVPAKLGNKAVVITYNHFVELRPGDPSSKINVNCPKKMARKPCKICQKADSLVNTGRKSDKDRAFQLYPKCRVYAAVINRDDEDAGVQVFAFGKKILEGVQVLAEDRGDFCDPGEEGYDLIIRKEGSGITGTKYSVSAAKHTSTMLEDASAMGEVIESAPSLAQYARVPTQEELNDAIEAALNGEGGSRDREEERPRSTSRSASSSSARSGSRRVEPDDDDLDAPIDTDGEDVTPAEEWDN